MVVVCLRVNSRLFLGLKICVLCWGGGLFEYYPKMRLLNVFCSSKCPFHPGETPNIWFLFMQIIKKICTYTPFIQNHHRSKSISHNHPLFYIIYDYYEANFFPHPSNNSIALERTSTDSSFSPISNSPMRFASYSFIYLGDR